MRIWMSCGLAFAGLLALACPVAAGDQDMPAMVGAIVALYAATLHLAVRFVQRWARRIAA